MRTRNDPRQYDDLAAEWWRDRGAFEPLHWLAKARADLVPDPRRPDAVLLDACCGGGLLAPHVARLGYRHVGVDVGEQAVRIAREHGVATVRGDVTRLPFADECADVVVAGECFEHVADLEAFVGEIARVLRPGGTLVADTLNDTALCKVLMVDVAERLPVVPRGIHDKSLFVRPGRLTTIADKHGIDLRVRGLRPRALQAVAWALHLRKSVTMVPTRSTAIVYQAFGVKR